MAVIFEYYDIAALIAKELYNRTYAFNPNMYKSK